MITRVDVRAGAMALILALAAGPLAGEPGPAPLARPSLHAQSLAPRSAPTLQQTAPTPAGATVAEPPQAFWRSPRGVAVAVMMAAVTGYVLYSRSNDRVKSPAS